MASSHLLRRRLVDALAIEDERVRDAFLRVPREHFLPGVDLEAVYRDDAIVTKWDERGMPISSSSQPQIMARMLERLALAPGLRVLEIGAGTGYNAALLKTIVGSRGRVVSVDVDPELARGARRALAAGGFPVRVVAADGREGYAGGTPYDRVIATASTPSVPVAWRDQLVEGGRLELPLQLGRADLQVVATFRRAGERLEPAAVVAGGFMPLRGLAPECTPVLVANESNVEGAFGPLAQVGGPGVGALSAPARRRLLATALGEGRRVPLGGAAPRSSLELWLALELPESRLAVSPRIGIGVVGRGGRSLALADVADQRPPLRPATVALAYGEPEAEQYLAKAIDRWRRAGAPGVDELELAVAFEGGESRITHSWRHG